MYMDNSGQCSKRNMHMRLTSRGAIRVFSCVPQLARVAQCPDATLTQHIFFFSIKWPLDLFFTFLRSYLPPLSPNSAHYFDHRAAYDHTCPL